HGKGSAGAVTNRRPRQSLLATGYFGSFIIHRSSFAFSLSLTGDRGKVYCLAHGFQPHFAHH
ncbi:MAG: hypothetical protein ACRD9R_13000, partial [Pyrinomonadaceae bacterium]